MFQGKGSAEHTISIEEMKHIFYSALDAAGSPQRVLVIPPDFTRYHSLAGELTQMAWHYYGSRLKAILPALGTHDPLTEQQRSSMFGDIPQELFVDHRWRTDTLSLGTVSADVIEELSEGALSWSWPITVNKLMIEGNFDLVLSIGQIVPHEVAGMANYHKNLFVGIGGAEGINKSHYLGAVYGMERILGKTTTPVRELFTQAFKQAADALPPVLFVHTVVQRKERDTYTLKGLYIGDDHRCYTEPCSLSQEVNITSLKQPVKKVVAYLDPHEYKSTWLGNKAIYRTRLALADGGELIILAPGVGSFGEDPAIDRLIRTYGYSGRDQIIKRTKKEEELQHNLSAAAHLIHGSPDGRFRVTYCPGKLSRDEIQQAGYSYGDLDEMMNRYQPDTLCEGWNHIHNEDVYHIGNPASGLWRYSKQAEGEAHI